MEVLEPINSGSKINNIIYGIFSGGRQERFGKLAASIIEDRVHWTSAPHDTAWLIRGSLKFGILPEEETQKLIDKLLLYKNQGGYRNLDGTWGEGDRIPHSAILDTISTMIAVIEARGIEYLGDLEKLSETLSKLILSAKKWGEEGKKDTVGFELLVPSTLSDLFSKVPDFTIAPEAYDYIMDRKEEARMKLRALENFNQLLVLNNTVAFSLEALIGYNLSDGSVENLKKINPDTDQNAVNGIPERSGVAGSVAATVALLLLREKHDLPETPNAINYIRNVYNDYKPQDGLPPNAAPMETTTLFWSLMRSRLISGQYIKFFQQDINQDTLASLITIYSMYENTHLGMSWDPSIDLPDLDNTSLGFAISIIIDYINRTQPTLIKDPLSTAGIELMPLEAIARFRDKNGFLRCYPFESQTGMSHILHTLTNFEILQTLYSLNTIKEGFGSSIYASPLYNKLLSSILIQIDPRGKEVEELLADKWHVSNTYVGVLWMSLKMLRQEFPADVKRIVEYFLDIRDKDTGCWGEPKVDGTVEPSVEETSYMLSGLINLYKDQDFLNNYPRLKVKIRNAILQARNYFDAELQNENRQDPPLWICKGTYLPYYIVAGAIIGAIDDLRLFERDLDFEV